MFVAITSSGHERVSNFWENCFICLVPFEFVPFWKDLLHSIPKMNEVNQAEWLQMNL